MLKLFIALFPVAVILILSEILWRKKIIQGERARKFIHILAGVYIAFWPFYIPFDGIFVLGCVTLTLVIYSRYTKLFHAIYATNRKTYGDILYALAIIICAYIGQEPWIFTVSILTLAIADGGAAVVGKSLGKNNTYKVLGLKSLNKSVAGTLAFIVFTYISLGVGYILGGSMVMNENLFIVFCVIPIVSAILENSMPYGFDNLATPVFITLLLNSLL
jgi:dolichol kinase